MHESAENMRVVKCLSAHPAQIAKYSFNTALSVSSSWSRSNVRESVRGFRSEDLGIFLPFSIFVTKSLNYFHLDHLFNLAPASGNSVVAWECSFLVDEHVLDANPSRLCK